MTDPVKVAPAAQTLRAAQRALVLMVTGYVVGATTLVALLRAANPGVMGWIVLLGAVCTYVLSVVFLRGGPQLKGAFASLVVLLLLVFMVPEGSDTAWLPIPNLTGSLCYAAVLLLAGWKAWPWIALGISVTVYAFVVRPDHVLMWAPVMPEGWLVIAQLLLACLLLWWMWRRLWQQAAENDALVDEVHDATRDAIRRQERAQAWRRSAVVVHETILNTIRYVMSTDEIDRKRLDSFGQGAIASPGRGVTGAFVADRSSLSSAINQVRLSVEPTIHIQLSGTAMSDEVDAEAAAVLRDALTEIARNAHEHGGARTLMVRSSSEKNVFTLVITDDGVGISDTWHPGIGLLHAVHSPIEKLGGQVRAIADRGRLVTTIIIPGPRGHRRSRQPSTSFNTARLTITAPLVGWVTGGVAVSLVFVLAAGWSVLPAVLAFGIVAAVAALILIRSPTLPAPVLLTAAFVGAFTPTVLASRVDTTFCTPETLAPAFLNASGFAVLALVLWLQSRLVLPVLIVGVWTAGGVWLLTRIPPDCREDFIAVELNTLFVVPILLGAAYFAVRVAYREQEQLQRLVESEVAELARAQAQEEFTVELASVAQQAQDTLSRIAGGATRDARIRRELAACDARIRTIIQVDPQASGPIGLAARHLVEYALDHGTDVLVRAISANPNTRAMPAALLRELEQVVSAVSHVSVQVTDSGEGDLLSLTLVGITVPEVHDVVTCVPEWMTVEFIDAPDAEVSTIHVLLTCPLGN
jgi:hypothetical protein